MHEKLIGSPHAVQLLGRRGFLAAAGVLPFLLASCSEDPKTQSVTPDPASFPVTVDHQFGSTTIDSPPSHVVVLGAAEADACTALGLAPGGMTKLNQSPWFTVAMKEINGPTPYFFDDSQGIPIDVIKKLEPDVILSLSTPMSEAVYAQLSGFAPVVLPERSSQPRDWRSNFALVGRVLGRSQAAKTITAETEQAIKDAVRDYPGLKGSSVLYLEASTTPGADIKVYRAHSYPMRLLQEFGMTPAPAASAGNGGPSGPVSYLLPREQSGNLKADVLVVAIGGEDMAAFKSKRTLPGLPAFGTGQVYFVSGNETFSLVSGSVLGSPWAARNVVPELAKAAYLSSAK